MVSVPKARKSELNLEPSLNIVHPTFVATSYITCFSNPPKMESNTTASAPLLGNSTRYWKEKYLTSLEERLSHVATLHSAGKLMDAAPGRDAKPGKDGGNRAKNGASSADTEQPLEFTMAQETTPASLIPLAAEHEFKPTDSPIARMAIESVLSTAAAMGDVQMDGMVVSSSSSHIRHQPLQVITTATHHYINDDPVAPPPPTGLTPSAPQFPQPRQEYYPQQQAYPFTTGRAAPPPIPVMQMTTRTAPTQRPIIPHPDHERWIAWTDIVRQRFPDWSGSTPAMSNYAKAFLKEHRLTETRVSPLTGITSKPTLGIPKDLQKAFMDGFDRKFRTQNGEWVQERRKGVIINLHPLGNSKDDRSLDSPISPSGYTNPALKQAKPRNFPHFIQTHNLPGQKPRNHANPSPIKRSHSQSSFVSNTSSVASTMASTNVPAMTRVVSSSGSDFILSPTETVEQRGHHVIKLWTDVIRGKHESFLLENARNVSLQTRVRNGVKDFITKNAPSLDLSLDSCLLMRERGKSSYGIPDILIPSFLNWFDQERKTAFKKYSDGTSVSDLFHDSFSALSSTPRSSFIKPSSSSSSLPALSTSTSSSSSSTTTSSSSSSYTRKRGLNSATARAATPRLGSEDAAAMEAFAQLSPESDAECHTAKRPRLTMDQSYELYIAAAHGLLESPPASAGIAAPPAAEAYAAPFGNTTRYTALVKRLMPTYPSLSKATRIAIKKSTKSFLMTHLGNSTDRLNGCIVWPKRGVFQTYTIPHCFYNLYNQWIRERFGMYLGEDDVQVCSIGTQTDAHGVEGGDNNAGGGVVVSLEMDIDTLPVEPQIA
ncbi:hypothetical protein SeLEV6574_g06364 [Synchytrium endobioticum]|nr:hypothetical protein SeLEV6574_g06364 [Synchytrium endobioticum]